MIASRNAVTNATARLDQLFRCAGRPRCVRGRHVQLVNDLLQRGGYLRLRGAGQHVAGNQHVAPPVLPRDLRRAGSRCKVDYLIQRHRAARIGRGRNRHLADDARIVAVRQVGADVHLVLLAVLEVVRHLLAAH